MYTHVHTYTPHYTNRRALSSKFLRRIDAFFCEKTPERFKSVEFVPRPRGGLLLNFKIRKNF